MSTTEKVGNSPGFPALPHSIGFLLRLAGLAILDVFALTLASAFYKDEAWMLAFTLVLITLLINVVNLVPSLWPLRWISPALALIILLAVYPLIYTVYVAFTNYSDGHRLVKKEAVELLQLDRYLPEGAVNYYWTPYRDADGNYALWLRSAEDETRMFFAEKGKPFESVTPFESGTEPYSSAEDRFPGVDGLPASINGYNLLTLPEFTRASTSDLKLTKNEDETDEQLAARLRFGDEENSIGINGRNEAGNYQTRWVFDEENNQLIDQQNNIIYHADDSIGEFVADNGARAPLGYWVRIGFRNFRDLINSSLKDGPLLRVFLWTISYAGLSVITAFAMGLLIALILDVNFVGVRIVRSLLIIPWAIPGMIGILIWRGMLNARFGVIPTTLQDLFGWAPPFFTDAYWAKFAVLLVNLWFAYPYFMLVCSGALQSIPAAIYEAAEVDGASAWNKFWSLTLPLLLVAVGPLLIASFVFNFNNYLLLEALNSGGPQMQGTNVPPVGHTDNLMTYTYSYAFDSGGRADFGFASAIAVAIFVIVGLLTIFQFRLTRRWEEIGENA